VGLKSLCIVDWRSADRGRYEFGRLKPCLVTRKNIPTTCLGFHLDRGSMRYQRAVTIEVSPARCARTLSSERWARTLCLIAGTAIVPWNRTRID